MYGLYHTFNFMTGYKQVNPSVQSIEWRLIVLESVAGVPGFVAAGIVSDILRLLLHQYFYQYFYSPKKFQKLMYYCADYRFKTLSLAKNAEKGSWVDRYITRGSRE